MVFPKQGNLFKIWEKKKKAVLKCFNLSQNNNREDCS